MMYLILAILLEVTGTVCMKFSNGFTNIIPSVLVFFFYGLCSVFLTLALRTVEIGAAYAISAGGGIFMIALIGILYFQETPTPLKILATILIIAGIIILNLTEA
ncbi:MAG: DMT family transporter [Verrucomicrobiota bacterium]